MDHSKPGSILIPLIEDLLERIASGEGATYGETKRMDSAAVMNKILYLRELGWSGPKIAKELGVCPQAIYDRLQRNKMKTLIIALLFVLPLHAQNVIKNTVTLEATASDATPVAGDTECGIASVQFYNGAVPIGGPIVIPPYILTLDTKTLANGTYTFTAKATDKAGIDGACDGTAPNVGTSNAVTVQVQNIPQDKAAPSVTINVSVTSAVSAVRVQEKK